MKNDSVFSPRLLTVWIVAAILMFAASLYFMGAGSDEGADRIGPSTFSRSAIGYAGIADVLTRLDVAVVKSRYGSLAKLTPGSVLVIAEPTPGGTTAATLRTLLKADAILLVLPKWTGQPNKQKSGWLVNATALPSAEVEWALDLVAPEADVSAVKDADWTTNLLGIVPRIEPPLHLIKGGRLRPIIGGSSGMLLGEIATGSRKVWVLSDPDVIANHGLAHGNAALAVAIVKGLLGASGKVVFDETIHGFVTVPASPILLMFRFPFVMATIQAAIAVGLLLWAALARFGAPQPAPPALSAGRQGLLENVAKLVQFTGHQDVMIRRYVVETVRDAARQLHAPRGLSTSALIEWLERVGAARGVAVDCGRLVREADALGESRRRNPAALVRLARSIHRWKGEIVDGR